MNTRPNPDAAEVLRNLDSMNREWHRVYGHAQTAEQGPIAKIAPAAPSIVQLRKLADLCSPAEWQALLTAHNFIDATCHSLAETQAVMSRRLGRKIALDADSVKNPGDEQL